MHLSLRAYPMKNSVALLHRLSPHKTIEIPLVDAFNKFQVLLPRRLRPHLPHHHRHRRLPTN